MALNSTTVADPSGKANDVPNRMVIMYQCRFGYVLLYMLFHIGQIRGCLPISSVVIDVILSAKIFFQSLAAEILLRFGVPEPRYASLICLGAGCIFASMPGCCCCGS